MGDGNNGRDSIGIWVVFGKLKVMRKINNIDVSGVWEKINEAGDEKKSLYVE